MINQCHQGWEGVVSRLIRESEDLPEQNSRLSWQTEPGFRTFVDKIGNPWVETSVSVRGFFICNYKPGINAG